jgi:hypothetical protein
MMLSVLFAIAAAAAPVDTAVGGSPQADTPGQSVNGGAPQKVAPALRTRQRRGQEHWSDGMNTTRTPSPTARDEYGAPKVIPPRGQGTNNAGSLPVQERKVSPASTAGDSHGR